MNTKGFLLLVVTVIVIGGSIGGAFSGGLALGRSDGNDAAPESALLQQRFGGGEAASEGITLRGPGRTGSQSRTTTGNGEATGSEGVDQTGQHPASENGQDAPPSGQVHPGQDGPFGSGGGTSGERAGFGGGILAGTMGTVDGSEFTVTTDSGETQVSLGEDSTVQIYQVGVPGDLSPGDRVLVIVSGGGESGEPAVAASVIVNPPEGGAIFGGGNSERFGGPRDSFGDRPRSPRNP